MSCEGACSLWIVCSTSCGRTIQNWRGIDGEPSCVRRKCCGKGPRKRCSSISWISAKRESWKKTAVQNSSGGPSAWDPNSHRSSHTWTPNSDSPSPSHTCSEVLSVSLQWRAFQSVAGKSLLSGQLRKLSLTVLFLVPFVQHASSAGALHGLPAGGAGDERVSGRAATVGGEGAVRTQEF